MRKGSTNSARAADRFVIDALITARKAGASGALVLRADSGYYGHDVIAAALRQSGPVLRHRPAGQGLPRRHRHGPPGRLDASTAIKYTDAVLGPLQLQMTLVVPVRGS